MAGKTAKKKWYKGTISVFWNCWYTLTTHAKNPQNLVHTHSQKWIRLNLIYLKETGGNWMCYHIPGSCGQLPILGGGDGGTDRNAKDWGWDKTVLGKQTVQREGESGCACTFPEPYHRILEMWIGGQSTHQSASLTRFFPVPSIRTNSNSKRSVWLRLRMLKHDVLSQCNIATCLM